MRPRFQNLTKAFLIGTGSGVWTTVSAGVRFLSSKGFLKRKRLNSRVISVGNIQAGGAGKTPLVAQIANEAAELGLQVCILIRGYKGSWESSGGIIYPGRLAAHDESGSVNAAECGDEAALLHDLCPHAYIGVGADRYQQYLNVLERAQTQLDLVILDDGFQNWRIHKDLEILALTSAKPWQVLFRDKASTVRDANLLVWTKGHEEPKTFGIPKVRVRFQMPEVSDVSIWLVAGVANQESVYLTALRAGYRIVKRIPFEDHARYDRDKVRAMLAQAKLENCQIAITGKDWVKWRDLGVLESEVLVLGLNLVFEEGREIWSQGLWGQSVF